MEGGIADNRSKPLQLRAAMRERAIGVWKRTGRAGEHWSSNTARTKSAPALRGTAERGTTEEQLGTSQPVLPSPLAPLLLIFVLPSFRVIRASRMAVTSRRSGPVGLRGEGVKRSSIFTETGGGRARDEWGSR